MYELLFYTEFTRAVYTHVIEEDRVTTILGCVYYRDGVLVEHSCREDAKSVCTLRRTCCS